MNELEIYSSIRTEIITNHVLMHWFSIVVIIILLVGLWLIEKRETVLCVFLPLLSLSWAASMVRFDFFIHRQTAYLKSIGITLAQKGLAVPLWETWKTSLLSTIAIVPIADAIISSIIVFPTIYILRTHTQPYFQKNGWKFGRVYSIGLTVLIILLLLSLMLIPVVSGWGQK